MTKLKNIHVYVFGSESGEDDIRIFAVNRVQAQKLIDAYNRTYCADYYNYRYVSRPTIDEQEYLNQFNRYDEVFMEQFQRFEGGC